MGKAGKWGTALASAALAALLLASCGEEQEQTARTAGQDQGAQARSLAEERQAAGSTGDKQEANQAQTFAFTDWTGHTVQVPNNPKRVIFHGETTGDLAVLGVRPVGILAQSIANSASEERFRGVEDIGFPFNVEKAASLEPDLIIFGNADEKQYETISKVGPTVTFDTFATLDERLRTLGKLLGKSDQAEQWLARYHEQEAAMWGKIRAAGIGENETATVYTFYPGNRLFVMAKTGLSQTLYSPGGLKPTQPVQEALDANRGFVEISFEALPQYAGDHVFLLTPVAAEAAADMENMKKSQIWNSLPAVKNGNVYTFTLIESYSDAFSREQMLAKLPDVLLGK